MKTEECLNKMKTFIEEKINEEFNKRNDLRSIIYYTPLDGLEGNDDA